VVPPAPSHSIPASGEPVRIAIETPAGDHPVVTVGLDENRIPIVPKHEVGWYQYSARPGEGENVVLWGHVLRFRETPNKPAPFAGLKHTPIGSLITLYTSNNKTYSYVVTEKVWATPDQVAYILPQGQEQLTMVSCIGEQVIVNGSVEDMSHRLITIAMPVP
jgi:sortase (surface protein transpeptidase)